MEEFETLGPPIEVPEEIAGEPADSSAASSDLATENDTDENTVSFEFDYSYLEQGLVYSQSIDEKLDTVLSSLEGISQVSFCILLCSLFGLCVSVVRRWAFNWERRL